MGFYVNPKEMTKEAYLETYGVKIDGVPKKEDLDWDGDTLPVVLMYNPAFSAAGVAYNESEFDYMSSPEDRRPKVWYLIEKKYLNEDAGLPGQMPWS